MGCRVFWGFASVLCVASLGPSPHDPGDSVPGPHFPAYEWVVEQSVEVKAEEVPEVLVVPVQTT